MSLPCTMYTVYSQMFLAWSPAVLRNRDVAAGAARVEGDQVPDRRLVLDHEDAGVGQTHAVSLAAHC